MRAAIDFGRAARNGDGALGWVATVGATVGATTCLLLMFALLARIWATLGADEAVRAAPVRGRPLTRVRWASAVLQRPPPR